MHKGPEAFRTISEVAQELDLPQHVLRFWETRFSQIKPLKRGGGRRYYRPDDVDLLRGIRHLLYSEGYTIRGVQRILREQGVRAVVALGHDGVMPGAGMTAARQERREPTFGPPAEPPRAEQAPEQLEEDAAPQEPAPAALSSPHGPAAEGEPLPRDVLVEGSDGRSRGGLMGRLTGGTAQAARGLDKEEVRRLQATLFELLECKRILDQAR